MKRGIAMGIGAAGLAIVLSCVPTGAGAEKLSDVEGARNNARAGGPTNAHDAELLRRWGATSNSRAWRKRWARVHR
jgi:hypothetical protein